MTHTHQELLGIQCVAQGHREKQAAVPAASGSPAVEMGG